MKATMLLAIALFLASAPSPDSKLLSDITSGLLSVTATQPLMASESALPLNTEERQLALD